MTNVEVFKEDLLKAWQELRNTIDDVFYYVEDEDFQKRLEESSWSVKEVLYHINMVNRHYLDQMKFESNSPKSKNLLKTSFFGRMLMKSMPKAQNGRSGRKYKTQSKVDPRQRQKAGYAVVSKVVFADLLSDLDEIKGHIEALPENGLHHRKLKSLAPIFKVYGHEALELLVYHSFRHIYQAESILKA